MRLPAFVAGLIVAAGFLVVNGPSAHAQSHNSQNQSPAKPIPVNIVVNPGDTLDGIATAHQTTYVRVFDANTNIQNPDLIYPGDSLRIPEPGEQLPDRPISAAFAAAQPVAAYTATPHAAPVAYNGSDVWASLAQCESGGNWAINTGNGFYGGLQFTAGTWLSNGGGAYAPTANLATPEQQIVIASKIQAARGWSPWPACSAKLSL